MKQWVSLLAVATLVVGCSREQAADKVADAKNATKRVVKKIHGETDIEAPMGTRVSREEMERERFNNDWRRLRSFQMQQQQQAARQQQAAAAGATNVRFVPAAANAAPEKLEGMNADAINAAAVRVPITGDVSGPSVLKAQVLLDRNNFSVGAIDGRWGKNSAIAVYWFQRQNGLQATGDIDEATYRALLGGAGPQPPMQKYQLTADDVKGPFTSIPDDVYDKEKLDCLCYESLLEKLGEKFHAEQDLLKTLNPGVDFSSLQAGATINAPAVRAPIQKGAPEDVAKIVVSVKGWYLHAMSADGRILFHGPTTLGSKYDPSPNETTKIVGIAHDPHYHYQPTLFHEVPDDEPEAHLQPGPNSPVGVVWMALSKPHFGIHGTNDPETIGYASSHGCVRLPNWDARDLAYRTPVQTVVEFVDTRGEKSDEPSAEAAEKSTK